VSTTHHDDTGPVVGFIRRHPLRAFLLWFFTVGQALAFTPVLVNASGGDLPVQAFVVASTLIGLLLPTLVITRLVDGPEGLRALWHRATRTRAALGWYLLAVLGVPLLALGIAATLLGAPTGATGELLPLLASGLLLPLALTFLPNNWWEEVAWQGFVQARLQDRRGPVVAAVLTGVLFALQHIALVAGADLISAAVLMAVLVVLAIPFRFLTGWLYNRTSSLFLVGLLHAMGNAVTGGSGFHPGLLARLYPGEQTATMAHLFAFFLVGLVALAATRGRLGLRRGPAATAELAPTAAPTAGSPVGAVR
jgi:uncharacterized protein